MRKTKHQKEVEAAGADIVKVWEKHPNLKLVDWMGILEVVKANLISDLSRDNFTYQVVMDGSEVKP